MSTPATQSVTRQRLLSLLQKHKEAQLSKTSEAIQEVITSIPSAHQTNQITDKYGNLISLNLAQQAFVNLASSGKSCVLIGAAGTGKTTCQKSVVQHLITHGIAGVLDAQGHKYLQSGTPGIVIVAYTRRAVANIRRNMPTNLQNNCITIHKLLEYEPDYEEIIDPVSGETKNKMFFRPKRYSENPLPPSIHTIIYEESSMIGTELYKEVQNATPHAPQEIFLGDIQQLPPVFGPAILGFKMLSLPTIELTEVYRQALESPIISLAHRILSGKGIPASEFDSWKKENQLTLRPWKKKISPDDALATAALFFTQAFDHKFYDPEEDIILIPFNESFGTIELNKKIANHLAKKRGAETFEIVAGYNKHYLSPGDKVMYDKEDAIVISIDSNPGYTGKPAQPSSVHLDYWGYNSKPLESVAEFTEEHMENFLANVVASQVDDRVRKASHKVTLEMCDTGHRVELDNSSQMNVLTLGYCLTVHKSQGSEWRKVFFILHQSHATMIQRELLYTAITRAREELYVICEPESLVKGVMSQRIKGNTLAEKAEIFKGKLEK